VKARLSDAACRLERQQKIASQFPDHIDVVTRAKREKEQEVEQKNKARKMAVGALRARQAMEMDALYHFLPVRVSGVKAKTRQPMQVGTFHILSTVHVSTFVP
jgi:hypothetical protein